MRRSLVDPTSRSLADFLKLQHIHPNSYKRSMMVTNSLTASES